jgi:hypothetical protein
VTSKGGDKMVHCHEMKKGQVYMCKGCGLELEVVKECNECGSSEDECKHQACEFTCCDEPLRLKGKRKGCCGS